MRILYVENHARFAGLAVRSFLAGHSVLVVSSLADARVAVEREEFEVVLLDYDLDDGKGSELAAELARRAGRPLLIAVSSHAGGNGALLAAGADAACGKLEFAGIEGVITEALASAGREARHER